MRQESRVPPERHRQAAWVLSRCTVQMPFRLGSRVQVLVESTTFLFLVSVAMLFPGLPSPALRARHSCSRQATPRLVAHHSLGASGQSSHIFLANKRASYVRQPQSPSDKIHSIIYGELQDSGLPSLSHWSFLPIT